ncbi:hypothetical protein ASG89_00715 [Paenibacillus sp. Soil766]|uniref:histidine kinase n=1 Tax=Paenibacillus sp. Soil766 TaxID=1736404 RepID=UPI000709E775|nr:histidine kinase [Paenibacillus sp. Soil766]KRF10096.1 hypothetical protein ASG89_00715 [Paenibacillus sp. Soil766]
MVSQLDIMIKEMYGLRLREKDSELNALQSQINPHFLYNTPMISPSLFLTLIITLIGSLKVFSQISVMTDGGPGSSTSVLVYYIYKLAFKTYDLGYASAVAFILFFLILVLTMVQWNFRKRWVHHEQ